jgi:hypothetical protein
VRCGLSSGSRDQLCSLPAVLLWSWVFAVLVYWGLFSVPCPLSLGQGQWSISWPLLSACCDGLLIVFQFCSVIWLCMLLTGSGDELYGPLLLCFRQPLHRSAVGPTAFPAFVYWTFEQRSALGFSPLLWCPYSTPPPLLCVSFQFFVYCSFFCFVLCFCRGEEVSLPRGLCCFIPWVARGILHDTWCSPVGMLDVSQAGLELVSGGAGALLVSQCNVAWRNFVRARGSGCQSFDSSWYFISSKCGSSVSARFLIYGAHSVCFCALLGILDPPLSGGFYRSEYRWTVGLWIIKRSKWYWFFQVLDLLVFYHFGLKVSALYDQQANLLFLAILLWSRCFWFVFRCHLSLVILGIFYHINGNEKKFLLYLPLFYVTPFGISK